MLERVDSTTLSVIETAKSREFWLSRDIAAGLEDRLASADILIVPLHEFRPGIEYAFHQDTTELFRYLQDKLAGEAVVDICARDDEYSEIALYSRSWRISQLVFSYAVAPLVISVLSSYIYDELKAKPGDTLEVSLVVEDDRCKSFDFSFHGNVSEFSKISAEVSQMARDCQGRAARKK